MGLRHLAGLAAVLSAFLSGAAPASASTALEHPGKVVVLGDSNALTLGFALQATAPRGTGVDNAAIFACGLAIAAEAAGSPGGGGLPMEEACNQATPPSQQWPALDRQAVAQTRPGDLIVFLAGHWETQWLLRDGTWQNITQPAFRRYEMAQLETLVSLATGHGAHLDLLTMPCMDGNYQFGRPPGATDSMVPRDLYNSLLEAVAQRSHGRATVVDFGRLVCPTGHFQLRIDGVQVRTVDGVHTPSYAPGNIFADNASFAVAHAFYSWLGPRLWPLLLHQEPARRHMEHHS